MTGIERLRHYAVSSEAINEIAYQIEREHAQTVEDHEKQQEIIRDLQRERDEALRAAAASRSVASELRALAGAWDEWGLGGPLMSLAERLEAHEAAAEHSTEVASKTYTRDELDERNASCDDHTSEVDATFEGEKVTRDASIAVPVLAVVEEMERHCLGVEGMEDSPVARWARELREVVGWPVRGEEDARAAKWVREHGGLESVKDEWRSRVPHDKHEIARQRLIDHIAECEAALGRRNVRIEALGRRVGDLANENAELRKRLMPDGMEWPMYWPGEPVRIGDYVQTKDGLDKLRQVSMCREGFYLITDGCDEWHRFGERVKRPKPAPVGADGVPITNGESVYEIGGDGTRLTVVRTPKSGEYQAIVVKFPDGNETTLDPPRLTHTKPESSDSWEKLEEDALLDPCDYFNKKLTCECADCTADFFDSCVAQHRADIVRRAKALAERERGE